MALQEPIRKRRLKPNRARTRTQACLSEAPRTAQRRSAHPGGQRGGDNRGTCGVSVPERSTRSWRASGDRATRPLVQERRARPLRAPDRARQTQIPPARRPPGPGCSPHSEARGAGGTGRPRLASPHRILREGRGPLALRQRPRKAQTRVLRSCPAPTRNGLPLPRPPRCSGPAPGRLPRADAPLAGGQSKELTETGRAGAAPRVGPRDPGHLPHGRPPPADRAPGCPGSASGTSRIERPRSQGAVCGLRPERATPTPPPKARNSPAPAEPRLQRSRQAKPTGAARPEPGRFPEATPSHFRAALGRREDRALCDPATRVRPPAPVVRGWSSRGRRGARAAVARGDFTGRSGSGGRWAPLVSGAGAGADPDPPGRTRERRASAQTPGSGRPHPARQRTCGRLSSRRHMRRPGRAGSAVASRRGEGGPPVGTGAAPGSTWPAGARGPGPDAGRGRCPASEARQARGRGVDRPRSCAETLVPAGRARRWGLRAGAGP